MITFRAKYLSTHTIQRLNKNDDYDNVSAAFVQLSPHNKHDLRTIQNVQGLWGGSNSYALSIAQSATREANEIPDDRNKYYAITRQKSKYEKLNPYEILGLAKVTQRADAKHEIDYLQVEPTCEAFSFIREYKNLGTAMLNGIKKSAKGLDIILHSVPGAINFYLKNGFEFTENHWELIYHAAKRKHL